jgi:hypothetical protein
MNLQNKIAVSPLIQPTISGEAAPRLHGIKCPVYTTVLPQLPQYSSPHTDAQNKKVLLTFLKKYFGQNLRIADIRFFLSVYTTFYSMPGEEL